jgi:hypothetical protein
MLKQLIKYIDTQQKIYFSKTTHSIIKVLLSTPKNLT